MWTTAEIKNLPKKYGCEILVVNATEEQIKDKNMPTDARIVKYQYEGKVFTDICRSGKQVNIFDLYYDQFGKGSLLSITFGYGTVNPRNWGYVQQNNKKK